MKLINNVYYKRFLKEPWSYTTGAVILGLLNITMLASTGIAWGVTTAFAFWGTWIFQVFGGHPERWAFFQAKANSTALKAGIISNPQSWSDIGIVFGALLATLLASQFRIKKIKSWKQVSAAVLGGLLMGYGARIAFGCNIGAFFSGVASMSLHGWIYVIFIFVGAWIGSKLLVKCFM